ncbi:uncharacterized protein At5g65660-like [Tasmannia lanceolata]|uniref:uncharacterized protein At5g65660-like n=1 Tax=Tasmannia lanceolata TaxID=3420 RepID=UPI0040648FDA
MDDQDLTNSLHVDTSRPVLGFPLGMALLLIIILCISGSFCCCFHWDKLMSLYRSFSSDLETDTVTIQSPSKSTPVQMDAKKKQSQPVLMPGDQIPTYIARPCPCEPSPPPEKITVVVQLPPPPPL